MSLEGRLIQNAYAVPMGPSAAQVFRNYKTDLAAKGYSILFEAKQADIGPAMGEFFEDTGPGTQIWGYSPDEARYAAAVKDNGGAKTYIALYVIEYDDGYEPRFHPEKGQVMVRLDRRAGWRADQSDGNRLFAADLDGSVHGRPHRPVRHPIRLQHGDARIGVPADSRCGRPVSEGESNQEMSC